MRTAESSHELATNKAWFTRSLTASSEDRHVSFFYCSRATLLRVSVEKWPNLLRVSVARLQ